MLEPFDKVRTSAFMDQVIHVGIERNGGSEPDRVSVECGRCSLDLSQQEARELAMTLTRLANDVPGAAGSQQPDGGNKT